jgi:cold shock CspA family protein
MVTDVMRITGVVFSALLFSHPSMWKRRKNDSTPQVTATIGNSRHGGRAGRGFGWPGLGEVLFVHYSGIVGEVFRSLEEGEKVTYEAAQGRKGMQAENVSKV